MPKLVSLDGTHLEGGGQLVRVALTLSALCGVPLHIHHIRGKRGSHGRGHGGPSGGLKESHLAALLWLQEKCGATVDGAVVGATEMEFVPARGLGAAVNVQASERIELKKPGSVWLVIQAILPYVLFSGMLAHPAVQAAGGWELVVVGGTNVDKSMSGEYVQQVLLPGLGRAGVHGVEVEVRTRGWAGNAMGLGEVSLRVSAAAGRGIAMGGGLDGFRMEGQGKLKRVVITVVAHARETVDTIMETAAEFWQQSFPGVEIFHGDGGEYSGDERRLYVLMVAETHTGSQFGRDWLSTGRKCKSQLEKERMLRAGVEGVVKSLKRELEHGGAVDEFLQDQLVVFQALAKGRSVVDGGNRRTGRQGSLHTRTVRWVCEEMLRSRGLRFDSEGKGECEGIGLQWSKAGRFTTEHINQVTKNIDELTGGIK